MVGVTGSIPVAPTSLRSVREVRLGKSVFTNERKAAAPKPWGEGGAMQLPKTGGIAGFYGRRLR
jgi:hypothetical protein